MPGEIPGSDEFGDELPAKQLAIGELVRLGSEFPLFVPGRTKPVSSTLSNLNGWITKIGVYNEEGDVPIPFTIELKPLVTASRFMYLTPFNPPAGYEITEEDLDPVKRAEKIAALRREDTQIDPKDASFSLSVDTLEEDLLEAGLLTDEQLTPLVAEFLTRNNPCFQPKVFRPETFNRVRQLRFHVIFPDRAAYEAQPLKLNLSQGGIQFSTFYRADFPPPVATAEHQKSLTADWIWPDLAVPTRESMLGVKGKFFFVDSGQLNLPNAQSIEN